jgi:multicomponent Na+:H+ antiporter subunit F
MTIALIVLDALLALAMAFALIRLVRGPTLADRVVALDLFTTLAVGFLALLALATGHWLYLDIALALGLVAFLSTIGFATLLERGEGAPEEDRR